MVTKSALVGSAAVVVLDPVRVEDLNLPVVQLHEERIRDISTGTIMRGMTHEGHACRHGAAWEPLENLYTSILTGIYNKN